MPCLAHTEESALWTADFRKKVSTPMGSKTQKGTTSSQMKNIVRKLKSNTKEQFGGVFFFLKTRGRIDVIVKGDMMTLNHSI